MNYLIVGAGFSGAVLARKLVEMQEFSVRLIDEWQYNLRTVVIASKSGDSIPTFSDIEYEDPVEPLSRLSSFNYFPKPERMINAHSTTSVLRKCLPSWADSAGNSSFV